MQGASQSRKGPTRFVVQDIRNKHYGSLEGRDLLSLGTGHTKVQELLHLAAQLKLDS